MTANKRWITNKQELHDREIISANNNKMQTLCSGNVNIVIEIEECEFKVPAKGILCIPGLTMNIISQLISNGNQVTFKRIAAKYTIIEASG